MDINYPVVISEGKRYEEVLIGGHWHTLELGELVHPTDEVKHRLVDIDNKCRDYIEKWLTDNALENVKKLILNFLDFTYQISLVDGGEMTEKGILELIESGNELNEVLKSTE